MRKESGLVATSRRRRTSLRRLLAVLPLLLVLLLSGCVSSDAWAETIYFGDNLFIGGTQVSPDAFGEMYITAEADTTIVVPGTYYKVMGTEGYDELRYFTGENDRLTYSGSRPRYFHVTASISARSNTVNIVTSWGFFVNDTQHASSLITRKISTAGDVGAMAMSNILYLEPGDSLELWVSGDKAGTVTAEHMVIVIASLN
jgi:hypothetical protein